MDYVIEQFDLEKPKIFRPSEHTPCLVYNGAHWKGYDTDNGKLVEYDSYKYKVQLGQTNNFCQSYACYLLANKGINELKPGPGAYHENIQCLSKKWLEYFNYENDKKFLQNEVDATNKDNKDLNDFTIDDIKKTLIKLVNDDEYALKFSQSKENIF